MEIKPLKKFENGKEYIFSYMLYRKFRKQVSNNFDDKTAMEFDGVIITNNNIPPEFCYLRGDENFEKLSKFYMKQIRRNEFLKL